MRKIIYLALVLLLAMAGTVQAQKGQGETVLFEEDFEDGVVTEDIFLSALWKVASTDVDGVQSSVLRGVTKDIEGYFLDVGFEWVDYAQELKLRVSSAAGISIYTRIAQSNLCQQGYVLDFFPAANQEYITYGAFAGTEDCQVNSLSDQVPYVMPINEWFTVRIEAIGTNHKVIIDGEELVNVTDATTTGGGSTGLVVFDPTTIEIDYLKITSISAATAGGTTTGGTTGGQMGTTTGGGTTGGTTGTGGKPTPTTAAVVSNTLTSFAGTHQEASAELEQLGLVPKGGKLLFRENYVYARGGSGHTPLARNSRLTDVVMAGEITATISGEDICAMMLRTTTNAQQTLFVGLDAAGGVFIFDSTAAGNGTNVYQELGLDLTQPHHFLVAAIGNSVSLWVDGEQIFTELPAELREGYFGLAILGGSGSSCESRNTWVYTYE